MGVPQGAMRTGSTTQLRIPLSELGQLLLKTDGGRQVLLEMLHDLLGVEVGREVPRGVVSRVRIRHVARQHAAESGGLHGLQTHRLAEQADLGVEPDVNEVREAELLADRIHLRLRVRHQVRLPDAQRRMHAVPTVVHGAAFPAASAAAGIGHGRASDVHHGGHRELRQGEDRFALRITDVVVHHIAWAEHHRHAQRAGGVEGFVHARDDGIHAHGRRLAPVKVPDIYRDDAHVPRVNLLGREDDFACGRITRLEGQFDLRGPSLSNSQERIRQNEDSARAACGKPAECRVGFSWRCREWELVGISSLPRRLLQ